MPSMKSYVALIGMLSVRVFCSGCPYPDDMIGSPLGDDEAIAELDFVKAFQDMDLPARFVIPPGMNSSEVMEDFFRKLDEHKALRRELEANEIKIVGFMVPITDEEKR